MTCARDGQPALLVSDRIPRVFVVVVSTTLVVWERFDFFDILLPTGVAFPVEAGMHCLAIVTLLTVSFWLFLASLMEKSSA